MNTFLASMGKRLNQRRKQLNLTQEELAELAGTTPQMISTAELGKKAIRPENIVKIYGALDISADYLLTGKKADKDVSSMAKYTKNLYENQFHCLEEVLKNFVKACENNNRD